MPVAFRFAALGVSSANCVASLLNCRLMPPEFTRNAVGLSLHFAKFCRKKQRVDRDAPAGCLASSSDSPTNPNATLVLHVGLVFCYFCGPQMDDVVEGPRRCAQWRTLACLPRGLAGH